MKSHLLVLGLILSSSLANAKSITFEGHDRATGQECGISFSLNEPTKSVSNVSFYHGSTVHSAADDSPITPDQSWLSGAYKLYDESSSGPYPGDWAKSTLKLYGDLGQPTGFKYEAKSGRYLFTGSSTVVECAAD